MNVFRKLRSLMVVALCGIVCVWTCEAPRQSIAANRADAVSPDGPASRAALLRSLPLVFEPNVGQTAPGVEFIGRGANFTVFVEHSRLSIAVGGETVTMSFGAPNAVSSPVGETELSTRTNYLVGNDPSKWRRNVPTFGSVVYEDAAPGIAAVVYGTNQQLEYDMRIARGADPRALAVRFEGQRGLTVRDDGAIEIELARCRMIQRPAVAYQDLGAVRRQVAAQYVARADGSIGIELGDYDSSAPLVIDPVLDFEVFLGGSGSYDYVSGIAVGSDGTSYVAGYTLAPDFPVTAGAYDTSYNSIPSRDDFGANQDAFVSHVSADGSTLLYSTYLGGVDQETTAGICVDASGNVYVAGWTKSRDFPTTPGAFDRTLSDGAPNGGQADCFVTKLSADGHTLDYSTLVGGQGGDYANGLALSSDGSAVVVGTTYSTDYPTTPGALDQTLADFPDGFVTKLNPDGSALAFSTFLGGARSDECRKVALDSTGGVYVAGETVSEDFPVTPGAYDSVIANSYTSDVFVARISADGAALVWASYLGGAENDLAGGIAVRPSGGVVVSGFTASSDFPVTEGAYYTAGLNGGGFVTQFTAGGDALIYSSAFGEGSWFGQLTLGPSGEAIVTGHTDSTDFPTTDGVFDRSNDGYGGDAVIFELSADGSTLDMATLLGGHGAEDGLGIARAPDGTIAVCGTTSSVDFPTTSGAAIAAYRGGDVFVSRLSQDGVSLLGSTYLSGKSAAIQGLSDDATDVAVDHEGGIYVVGATNAPTFPTTPGTVDPMPATGDFGYEAFVSKLNPQGTALEYSTFLGGTGYDAVSALAIGTFGEVYLAGQTTSPDFPTTPNVFDTQLNPSSQYSNPTDSFIAKLSPDGTSLVFSTFLGGTGDDVVRDIAVRGDGAVCVAGWTTSADLPTTGTSYDTSFGGDRDGFVTLLNRSGRKLLFSTYLGGSGYDEINGLALNSKGAVFVAGATRSATFPVTPEAFDTTFDPAPDNSSDGFVCKFSPNGSSLRFSTLLGGASADQLYDVVLDPNGRPCVVGMTSSADYPITPGAFDVVYNVDGVGGYNADTVVTRLSANGRSLVASTFLGGSFAEGGEAIAVDHDGRLYVTGWVSSDDFPTTPDAISTTINDASFYAGDAYLTVLAADASSLVYSTYLGGDDSDIGWAIAVDTTGAAVVAGSTWSRDFAAEGFGVRDRFNAFVLKIRLSASAR